MNKSHNNRGNKPSDLTVLAPFLAPFAHAVTYTVVLLALLASGCASTSKSNINHSSNSDNNLNATQIAEPGPYQESAVEDKPSVVAYSDYKDPLRPINNGIFKFNNVIYRYFLTPVSKGYRAVMPDPVSKSISNFFSNLREPLFSINNLFQGKPRKSGTSLLRLGINSTLGLFGLFDPAEAWWDIERQKTSFGDTLAYHGVGYGAYLVLPILGPSDLRDGASFTFDYFAHPLKFTEEDDISTPLLIYEGFHEIAPTLEQYPDLIKDAQDPYVFVRNLYLQRIQRDAQTVRDDKNADKVKKSTGSQQNGS